jgi:hypothetical protein
MKRAYPYIFVTLVLVILLAACGKSVDQAALAVENYLNAIVAKDADRLSTLTCADWEMQALLELDSFQAVETQLQDLACTSTPEQDGTSSVNCTGKILATYNEEVQEFDLSLRTYIVVEQGGEFLVCGYR